MILAHPIFFSILHLFLFWTKFVPSGPGGVVHAHACGRWRWSLGSSAWPCDSGAPAPTEGKRNIFASSEDACKMQESHSIPSYPSTEPLHPVFTPPLGMRRTRISSRKKNLDQLMACIEEAVHHSLPTTATRIMPWRSVLTRLCNRRSSPPAHQQERATGVAMSALSCDAQVSRFTRQVRLWREDAQVHAPENDHGRSQG